MNKVDNYFKNIIITNRPLLSSSTIKTYIGNMRKIKAVCPNIEINTMDDIIDNRDAILKCLLDTMTPMVRKSKIGTIITILDDKHNDHSDKLKDAISDYRKVMNDDANTVNKGEEDQELTESQRANLISQEDVMKVYKQLKAEATPIMKLSKINKKQFETLQNYVLLSLYVLIPPRRSMDYAVFKIRNFDESAQSKDNYMANFSKTKKKGLSSFVFNTYKNSKKMGQQILNDIPKDLEKIIEMWKGFNKSDYLLINSLGNPITQAKITIWLNDIFGKNISTSILRHIYLSSKYKDVNLKDDAKALGQSDISRTLKYVDKDYDNVVKENKEKEKA